MKFSTAFVLSGAAVASAAVVPRDSYDSCPVVKKTVTLSWVELSVFEKTKAVVWTKEQVKQQLAGSKYDASQVYPHLNQTNKGYPTGSRTATGVYTSGMSKTTSLAPFPTGKGSNSTMTIGTATSGTETMTTAWSSTSAAASATGSATLQQAPCNNPKVRREWGSLGDGDRDNYVSAVKCLMNKPSGDSNTFKGSRNRYEDFASLHMQVTPSVHSTGQFLAWHRYLLNVWESVLQSECGYNGPLVWWDETQWAGNFHSAPLFDNRWFGALPGPQNGQGVCITETGWGEYKANIGPDRTIDNEHCLSRAVDEGQTGNVNSGWVNDCKSMANYDDFRSCTEFGPHAYGHNGVGAIMADVAPSPEDPLFFVHHGFVDQMWKDWQNQEWWNRVYEIGGPDGNGGTTTPDYVLTSFGMRPDVTIADVLDTESSYLCYVYQ